MAALERDQLENILGKMFDMFEKKNQMPKGVDKKSAIKQAADFLEQDGPVDDSKLKSGNELNQVMKVLMSLLMTTATSEKNNDKNLSFDPKFLFKSYSPAEKDELKKDAKEALSMFLNALNMKCEPGSKKSAEEMANAADKLAEDLTLKHMNSPQEENLAQNQDAANLFSELSMSLSQVYGGVDPRFEGGVQRDVESLVNSLTDYVDNAPPGGYSFASQKNTPEPGAYDYTGSEAFEINNAISSDAMGQAMEQMLVNEGQIDSPEESNTNSNWPPRPHK